MHWYNKHDCVDLGLSVKWATCNVGASKPEDGGSFFAWAETKPKDNYSWGSYKWAKDYDPESNSFFLTKYNEDPHGGVQDGKYRIEPEDDPARVNWGGSWRVPTYAELMEFLQNTDSEWTRQNGVWGRLFTSKVPGHTDKSIFLPAAGHREFTTTDEEGTHGYYWTSECVASGIWSLAHFYYLHSGTVDDSKCDRCYGRMVRPVCD